MRFVFVSLITIAAVACSSTGTPSAPGGSDGPGDSGASDARSSVAPTFTNVYTMVLAQKCMPCHTTAAGIGVTSGKLDMTTQSQAYTELVAAPAAGSSCSGKGTRVVAGNPDLSVMYLKVSLDDPSPCGSKMPLGGPSLAPEEVSLIEDWINGGAKND